MGVVPYDYIDQNVISTLLIVPLGSDSFYSPVTESHTGFAFDGNRYTNGVPDAGPITSSWFNEFNPDPASAQIQISSVQIISGLLTVRTITNHHFTQGQGITFYGIATAAQLNSQLVTLATASGNLITANTPLLDYALTSDAGFAAPTPYRGEQQPFPQQALLLLDSATLTILDATQPGLPLWMQFLLHDQFALADNFNGQLNSWTPTGLAYADGVISVSYAPDPGSTFITSNMVVNIDFTQDKVYLDVGT